MRFDPITELFIELPALDGFELEIQWGNRWLGDTELGDPEVDRAYFIRTNDPTLTRIWLDPRGRRALHEQRQRIEGRDWLELERVYQRYEHGELSDPRLARAQRSPSLMPRFSASNG